MTAEPMDQASPKLAGGAETPGAVSHQTFDLTAHPAGTGADSVPNC